MYKDPSSDPSSDPGLNPGSDPGSDPGLDPSSDPGSMISLSPIKFTDSTYYYMYMHMYIHGQQCMFCISAPQYKYLLVVASLFFV